MLNSFSQSEIDTLFIVLLTFGVINSLANGIEVITLIYRKRYANLHEVLVIYHLTSNSFYWLFSGIVAPVLSRYTDMQGLCTAMGFISDFTFLHFIFWDAALGINGYIFLTKPAALHPENLHMYHIIIWPAAFLGSFLPMTTFDYKHDSGCRIGTDEAGLVWRLLILYLPSLICFFIIWICLILISVHLHNQSKSETKQRRHMFYSGSPVRFLLLHPIVLTICYMPGLINGFNFLANGANFPLQLISYISSGIYSWIVIAGTERLLIKKLFRTYCCRSRPEQV